MTSDIIETPITICSVCEKELLVGRSSQSGINVINKATSGCRTFKKTHFNFTINVLTNSTRILSLTPKHM